MHSDFTSAESISCVFIAATTVARAEAFLGNRPDAYGLHDHTKKLIADLAEAEKTAEPASKTLVDYTKLLLTAMAIASGVKDPARLDRWREVMAALAKEVRAETASLREALKSSIKSEQDMRARLAELDAAIAAAPCWGAAITAMDEERRGIKRALGAEPAPDDAFQRDRAFAQMNTE